MSSSQKSLPEQSSPLALGPRAPLPRPTVVARLRAAGCVFAEDEAELLVSAARTPDELAVMVEQRVIGLPLEHVVGWAEFRGLRVAVDPGVFVPRRRTEFLVGRAVDLGRRAAERTRRPTVAVDLCCGSGAVGAALAADLERVELYAADIEPAAVRCARRNVAATGGAVYQGDLFDPLPAALRGRIDILVANVPYVPSHEVGLLPPEARDHEPLVALDGGADGLDVLRRVTATAPRWLAPGGHLLVETSERQAPRAVEAFTRNGLLARVETSDELYATIVIGTRPDRRQEPSPGTPWHSA
ncbi:putative protein N(5)-glutamine methyltransferase [Streptomyces sp. NPDC050355]|uniref:putative protein N(5)-glutamine methyltransferase n=1 Tax=Streptomyces sp. NPDC050355 TaxID=3365609 RepID=UPI0037A6599F